METAYTFELKDSQIRILEDGKIIGHVAFQKNENVLDVVSTQVDASQRGKGIAQKLMQYLYAYSKQEGYKLRPICSYVIAYYEKHIELQDQIVD